MLLLSEAEVERLITPKAAIATARAAYIAQSSGSAGTPGRTELLRDAPRFGALVLAGTAGGGTCIVKSNTHAYPPDGGPRRAASLLALWDMAACRPLALLASAGFNNHRTAAGFCAAAEVLARPDAETLVVIGAGKIAPESIRYLVRIRPIRRVIILGKRTSRAVALAAQVASWPGCGHLRAEPGTPDAVAEADILLTITTAETPVFDGALPRPGCLVILGGSNRPAAREADDTLLSRAAIWVDHLAGALDKAGDLRLPHLAGRLHPPRLRGEIGALLAGQTPPPKSEEIRVFKSIGIAPQDVLLAEAILAAAIAQGIGQVFDPHG